MKRPERLSTTCMSKTPISSSLSQQGSSLGAQAYSQVTTPTDTDKSKKSAGGSGGTPRKSPEENAKKVKSITLTSLCPIDGHGVVKRVVCGTNDGSVFHKSDTAYVKTLVMEGNDFVIDGVFRMPKNSGCVVGYILE